MADAKFIAFCGGEGAGKSTQIRLLAAHLQARGVDALVTREPGGTAEGQHLRQLLLTSAGQGWDPFAETLLMVADRAQHVARVIRPALAQGRHVITDRYVFSTLAYQGAGRGVQQSFIRQLHAEACGDLWPDLTIVLDIDPASGLARSQRRLSAAKSDESRFEALDLDFHRRVRAAFLELAGQAPRRAVVLDAAHAVEEIQAAVRAEVEAVLGA